MNTNIKEPKSADTKESPEQQTGGCGAGCGCHSAGKTGGPRVLITAIVLIVAGVLVVRAMNKAAPASPDAGTSAFATPVVASATTALATPNASRAVPVTDVATPASTEAVQPTAAIVGAPIGAFAELNTVAVHTDAVFVYLPGKQPGSAQAPASMMQAAVAAIESKGGAKCGLFTLTPGSADYDQLDGQIAMPGVLAMVKGRGVIPVTGEITETKLIQGYVAASSAGGCGSGGCGPASTGCK